MRVIITGGSGMIGRALAGSLLRDGHDVIVLSRNPAARSGVLAGAQIQHWDARTADGWGHLAEGADAIVNLAGERVAGPNPFAYRWTEARKRRICESRRRAGEAVTQAVERAAHKPGVVVQISGTNYYPPTGKIATENTPPGDDFLARVCKDCWELPTAPVERMGVRRVIVRTGPVLDAHEGALPPMLLQTRLFVGGRIGSGRQWFPWVHRADVAAGIRFLIDTPEARGAFNLCAPNPLTNAQFAQTLARVLGRPAFVRVPAWAMRLLFGEMAVTLLQGPRAMPARLQEIGFAFRFPEAEAALRDLLGR